MKTVEKWYSSSERLPENGREVKAMDSGGNVTTLVYDRNLWWFPDYSMYVYYVPEKWAYVE